MSLSFQQDFRRSLHLPGAVQMVDHRALVVGVPRQAYVEVLAKVHESCQQILAYPVLAASLVHRAQSAWRVQVVC